MLNHRFTRLRKSGVLVTAIATCGVLLAGCGAGPSQLGSAAIVGDHGVSLSDTEKRINTVLSTPGLVQSLTPQMVSSLIQQDPKNPKYQNLTADEQRDLTQTALARGVVTAQVRHLLLAEAARRAGITITPKQLTDALASKNAQSSFSPIDLAAPKEAIRDRLIAEQLAVRQLGTLSITADEMLVDSRAKALDTAHALAAGGTQATAVLNEAKKTGRGGEDHMTGVQAAQSGAIFLLGIPTGEVVAISGGGGAWLVLHVTHRDTTGKGSAGIDQLDPDTLAATGMQLVQPLAEQLQVRVNPRYGTWDALRMTVLGSDHPASIVLPASAG